MFARPRTWLLVIALAASAGARIFSRITSTSYFADILTRIGINITLAVSLNLHQRPHRANFRSATRASWPSAHTNGGGADDVCWAALPLPAIKPPGANPCCCYGSWWRCLRVVWWRPAAGVLVGAPSLRLRGDYLAIVTLGFRANYRASFSATSNRWVARWGLTAFRLTRISFGPTPPQRSRFTSSPRW